MSAGFRKSLFGFNQNDVIEYVRKSSEAAKQRENELLGALEESKKENEILEETNIQLSSRVAEFERKCNEINAMCEKMSRLYVTAKASSKALVDNTEENCKVLQVQIDNNLNTLEEVQSALSKLKSQVMKTADVYTKEVDSVSDCLQTAKDVINSNKEDSEDALKKFGEALNK